MWELCKVVGKCNCVPEELYLMLRLKITEGARIVLSCDISYEIVNIRVCEKRKTD